MLTQWIIFIETCVIWAQLINSSVPEQYLNNVSYKTIELSRDIIIKEMNVFNKDKGKTGIAGVVQRTEQPAEGHARSVVIVVSNATGDVTVDPAAARLVLTRRLDHVLVVLLHSAFASDANVARRLQCADSPEQQQ